MKDAELDSFGNKVEGDEPILSTFDLLSISRQQLQNVLKNISPSINVLPSEILLQIFSLLDPMTLNDIWKVCKRWKQLVQMKEIWYKSFGNEFQTLDSFPTISNSKLWVTEYVYRLKSKRNWYKSHLTCQYYKIFPDDYPRSSQFKADFENKRLYGNYYGLTSYNGEFVSCNLLNGRNLTFIPSQNGSRIRSIFNQLYLIQVDEWHNPNLVKVKNLQAAKSSGSNIKSTIICDAGVEVHCLDIKADNSHSLFDFISGDMRGTLMFWNFKGKLIKLLKLTKNPLVYVKSDYRSKVFAVDALQNIYYIEGEGVANSMNLNVIYKNNDNLLLSNFSTISGNLWRIEVDFGSGRAIFTSDSKILIVDIIKGEVHKYLDLPEGTLILNGSLQSIKVNKLYKYEDDLVGNDAVMYCNLLSDNSIIVWNIRDNKEGSKIVPQCHFALSGNLGAVNCIALNCLAVVVGYSKGFCEIYDLYSGNYIRHTKKQPKSFKIQEDFEITQIILNPDPMVANGIVVTEKFVQYFQFGELPNENIKKTREKPKKLNNSQKVNNRSIKVQIDEYDRQEEEVYESKRLVNKFNGDFMSNEDDLDDISLAIAVSQSENPTSNSMSEEEQLRLALEISMQSTSSVALVDSEETSEVDDFSKQLEEALRLSLRDS